MRVERQAVCARPRHEILENSRIISFQLPVLNVQQSKGEIEMLTMSLIINDRDPIVSDAHHFPAF